MKWISLAGALVATCLAVVPAKAGDLLDIMNGTLKAASMLLDTDRTMNILMEATSSSHPQGELNVALTLLGGVTCWPVQRVMKRLRSEEDDLVVWAVGLGSGQSLSAG